MRAAGRSNGVEAPVPGSSIERALAILEVLVEQPGASLATISRAAGVTKPTTHRILQTLIRRGYAESHRSGVYLPGSQLVGLAGRLLNADSYARRARPVLRKLASLTPEAIQFGMLLGNEAIRVEKVDGRAPNGTRIALGTPIALPVTALGRSILAHLPPDSSARQAAVDEYVRGRDDPHGAASHLERELAAIRARGFALDARDGATGLTCVGAPVFGGAGTVVGGISVLGPSARFTGEAATALVGSVVGAARDVSGALGAPPATVAHAGD